MSYMLGLSFKYHRYRQDAVVKIYADDRLVDELRLSENINYKTIVYKVDDCPFDTKSLYNHNPYDSEDYNAVLIMPEKLFLFEIEEKFLTRSIRIEVDNSNSNYTNGFMTDYSYIEFYDYFLLPSCFLEGKSNWMKIKRFDSWQYPFPSNNFFPFINDKAVTVKFPVEANQCDDLYFPIGGSFTIELSLHKKYKLINIGKPGIGKKKGIVWDTARILWAFDAINT